MEIERKRDRSVRNANKIVAKMLVIHIMIRTRYSKCFCRENDIGVCKNNNQKKRSHVKSRRKLDIDRHDQNLYIIHDFPLC